MRNASTEGTNRWITRAMFIARVKFLNLSLKEVRQSRGCFWRNGFIFVWIWISGVFCSISGEILSFGDLKRPCLSLVHRIRAYGRLNGLVGLD